ncbi:MAG: hypothetical protein GY923_15370 [Aestuariibacter sp.]|nr:hypothetical protein [Aestuariibacter sp.]
MSAICETAKEYFEAKADEFERNQADMAPWEKAQDELRRAEALEEVGKKAVKRAIESGVPERHADKFLSDVRQTNILKSVMEWHKTDSWLCILADNPGTGKSFAAAYCLWNQIKSYGKSYAGSWEPDWFYAADIPDMNREDIKKLNTNHFMVIDDLGSEYYSDKGWFISRFYNILSHRYDNMRRTIITTNLSAQDVFDRYNDPRLIRRIKGEDGDVMWFGS